MFNARRSRARGLQTLPCLKYCNVLKWKSRFTLKACAHWRCLPYGRSLVWSRDRMWSDAPDQIRLHNTAWSVKSKRNFNSLFFLVLTKT